MQPEARKDQLPYERMGAIPFDPTSGPHRQRKARERTPPAREATRDPSPAELRRTGDGDSARLAPAKHAEERPAPPISSAVIETSSGAGSATRFLIWLKGHLALSGAVLIVTGLAVFGGSLYFSRPVYRSETTIKFNFETPPLFARLGLSGDLLGTSELEEEKEVLKSDHVLKKALQEVDDPSLGINDRTPPEEVESRIRDLRERISFEHGKDANILVIRVSATSPEPAKKELDALVRAYIAYDTERQRENDTKQAKFLEGEIERLKKKMEEMEDVETYLKEIDGLKADTEAMDREIEAKDREIERQKAEIVLKREQLARDFTLRYPGVIELDETLARLDEIRVEKDILALGKFQDETLEKAALLRYEALLAVEKKKANQARIEEVQDSIKKLGFSDPSPVVVRQQLQSMRDDFQLYSRTLSTIQLSLARSSNDKIEGLREQATVQNVPVLNSPGQTLSVASLVTLVFAILVLLGFHAANPSLVDPRDIERLLAVPLLATIPRVEPLGRSSSSPQKPKDFFAEGPSVVADYFRILAASLRSHLGETPYRLVVTSADAWEGKSTVSLNTAIAFAEMGYDTILVSCNLRRPSLESFLEPGQAKRGIIDCARDEKLRLRDLLAPTRYKRLSVIPSGEVGEESGVATKFVSSVRFRESLADLQSIADVIVLDSSPVLLVSDPLILAGLMDGVIFVFRAGVTSMRKAERALSLLARAGVRVLGVVANSRYVDSASSYRRPYRRSPGKTPTQGKP
ncbi:MAG: hypothetical protein HY720_08925 [Planctomycetes bacterium]|nr:hypothetical protein [Planctomycetota bacterium]